MHYAHGELISTLPADRPLPDFAPDLAAGRARRFAFY